ncbi:STAS domain-containing protein [Micromonospora sp. NPDC094482]|uniref:STAS domain-containing protein n=1 Tax=unclassified Micromonospora TaxID=2617518 RepID=UPI003331103C
MPAQLLTIEVSRLDAATARLTLTGDLDFDTAPQLISAAAELRQQGCQQLVIDLSRVDLCDSSGLSAFLVAHRAGTNPIRLTGVSPQLQQLLDRTGLAELLAVARASDGELRAIG